jgi:hypothetical protein
VPARPGFAATLARFGGSPDAFADFAFVPAGFALLFPLAALNATAASSSFFKPPGFTWSPSKNLMARDDVAKRL